MIHSSPTIAVKTDCKAAGFTLIEMMMVVLVLAIIAGIAIPTLSSGDDLTASATARMVLADLLYAQNQAISSGAPQVVSFTVAGGTPNGDGGGYSLAGLTNPVTLQPYNRSFGAGAPSPYSAVALTSVTFDSSGGTDLTFGSLGQPVGLTNQGVIQLQCGSMVENVYIEPVTGNLTISP